MHLPARELRQPRLGIRHDRRVAGVVLQPPEVAHDRVVAFDLEVALLGGQFALGHAHRGAVEPRMPGERGTRVQMRRRVVGDFAQRERAQIFQAGGVARRQAGEHFRSASNPLGAREAEVANAVRHRGKHGRVVAGSKRHVLFLLIPRRQTSEPNGMSGTW